MKFDNEIENFEILTEEASEICEILLKIIKLKSKIIRFGKFNNWVEGKTNIELLEKEIGDFLAIIEILIHNKTLSKLNIDKQILIKLKKLENFYNVERVDKKDYK